MPVTKTQQARIELTEQQYISLAVLFDVALKETMSPPMIAIEETNIPGVIAISSKHGMTLMERDGTYRHLSTLGSLRTFTGEKIRKSK